MVIKIQIFGKKDKIKKTFKKETRRINP